MSLAAGHNSASRHDINIKHYSALAAGHIQHQPTSHITVGTDFINF